MSSTMRDIDILEQLLDEPVQSVRERARTSFDETEQKIKSDGLILFGCGLFGKRILKGLRKIGIEPLGFSDNNQKIWGNNTEGHTVFSPEEAANKYPRAVYMVTIWSDAIGHPVDDVASKLHSYQPGIEVISFFHLFWKYPDLFVPYFSIDTPDKTIEQADAILDCFSLFEDDHSRNEFIAQIRWRLWADHKGLTPPGPDMQYFPSDLFKISAEEVFVDCGAFDGDTLKNFLKKQGDEFKRYYAFEPDPANFEKLKAFATILPDNIRDKVIVEQYAISDTKKVLNFSSDGSLQSAISENGNISVNCVSVDEHLADQRITYIKMDVEGAEPDIIAGSVITIKKYQPIMAVSVYHLYNHLWLLPLAIKEIFADYQFFLRPHCKASGDLVCYAIPKERLFKN